MTHPAPPKSKLKKDARDTRAKALKIANSIKMEGQADADTKAIAKGIQQGMGMFLRQQSEKSRELDKRVKKVKQLSHQITQQKSTDDEEMVVSVSTAPKLPWILLGLSWALFLAAAMVLK